MADPVDLEALDRLWEAPTADLSQALIRAYPALREEIVSLRDRVQELGGPFCMDTGAWAVHGLCPEHKGDACLRTRLGAAKEIQSLRERVERQEAIIEEYGSHHHHDAREHLRRVVQAAQAMMKRHHDPIQYDAFPDLGDLAAALSAIPPALLEEPRDG